MKIFIICVITLVVSIGNLYAFEKNDSNEVNGDILKKRPVSFEFAIGSMLNLTNFANLNISAKKHFSKNFAVRLGVGFNFSKEDLNSTQSTFTSNNDPVSESFNNRLFTALDMIYYFNPDEYIKPYGGVGPYFSYVETSFKRDRYAGSSYYYYSYHRAVSVGANALVGIEWFASKKFSLFAEYNFAFTYSWLRDIDEFYDVNDFEYQDLTGNEIEITGKQLKFGLSVYF